MFPSEYQHIGNVAPSNILSFLFIVPEVMDFPGLNPVDCVKAVRPFSNNGSFNCKKSILRDNGNTVVTYKLKVKHGRLNFAEVTGRHNGQVYGVRMKYKPRSGNPTFYVYVNTLEISEKNLAKFTEQLKQELTITKEELN